MQSGLGLEEEASETRVSAVVALSAQGLQHRLEKGHHEDNISLGELVSLCAPVYLKLVDSEKRVRHQTLCIC